MFSNTCNQCGYCKRRNHLPIFYAKIVEMFGYTKGIVCPKPTSHWKDRDTSLLYCKSSLLCWIIYMLCFKSYFLASYQQQAVKKNKAKTIQCLFSRLASNISDKYPRLGFVYGVVVQQSLWSCLTCTEHGIVSQVTAMETPHGSITSLERVIQP